MNGRVELSHYDPNIQEKVHRAIELLSVRLRVRGGLVPEEQSSLIAEDLGIDPDQVLQILLHTQAHAYPEVPEVLRKILSGGLPIFWTNGEIHRGVEGAPFGYAGFQPFKLFNLDINHILPEIYARAVQSGLEMIHGGFDKFAESVLDPIMRAVSSGTGLNHVIVADDNWDNLRRIADIFSCNGLSPALYHVDRAGVMDKRDSTLPIISISDLGYIPIQPALYMLDVDRTVVDTIRLKLDWAHKFADCIGVNAMTNRINS
ncbi:MAG: hypothetical protein US54_C0037G0006 [Candidatus Roizmanbacteria bacterium GW2011_GWA2_37_7]|uniref:Uncharacterized protein n=1 Tax=Candidatus Roizmanbacteria bacterium GW2011_GWA2_37_7 TaxID=1618481 RepID=A0A0G0H232_9BACT|nr:MAG: hypothetical protein US54_C0037G0006 [Candidatus Roizmanbacteria bacterium GW2011_GWA2_37_7]